MAQKKKRQDTNKEEYEYQPLTEEELDSRKKMDEKARKAEMKQGKKTEKQKKRRKKKKIILLVVEILLLSCLALAIFVIRKFDLVIQSDFSKEQIVVNEDLSEDTLTVLSGYRTIAVFGLDARDMKTEKGHSDVVMLVSINNATGDIKLCSVFRDTFTKDAIDESGTYRKLTTMYWRDGALGGLGALNMNLDLNITDYVSVNWYAVAKAIDLLGGIDIEVPESMMKYINGYIQETRNSTGLYTDPDDFESDYIYSAGYQHLNGVQAVAFCRIRYIDSDYGRAARQREVVSLILEKAKSADLLTLNNIANEVLGYVETNLEVSDVLSMVKAIAKFNVVDQAGFPFEKQSATVDGTSYVFPVDLEKNVQELHQFLYDVEDYNTSSTVRAISNYIKQYSGFTGD
jgi:LCP family protein required for cell wall assembly